MDKFEASNGGTVDVFPSGRMTITDHTIERLTENAVRTGRTAYLDAEMVPTLREFFQAERDEELRRWRWPEIPDYVVYADEDGDVTVLNEPKGATSSIIVQRDVSMLNPNHPHVLAARAYFEAHPEPKKPWEDAVAGEAWVLTIGGSDLAVTLDYDREFRDPDYPTEHSWMHITDSRITAGRRIYPEEAS